MILHPQHLRLLVSSQELDFQQVRVILYNYIYYKTGTKENNYSDGKKCEELINHPNLVVTNIPNFERCVTIACNYFL